MERLKSAKKVFFAINQELGKIDKNTLVVKKLKLINEELADAVIQLIKNYESCKNLTNSATLPSNNSESISEEVIQEKQMQSV
jgi:ATP-dependent Lon protease